MICRNCGAQMGENDRFCMVCGTKAEPVVSETVEPMPVAEETAPQDAAPEETNVEAKTIQEDVKPAETEQNAQSEAAQPQSEPAPQQSGPKTIVLPKAYKPIGMWGYFGYDLLFAVPVVGLICIIIFAFGESKNKNLRNYARSKFCWAIIGLVALAIFFVSVLLGGVQMDWMINRW